MKFQELQYVLPSCSAKDAAAKAIEMLEAVRAIDETCLFYVAQPSNILALAGLRAQSPYNEFLPSLNQETQSKLASVLSSHGFRIQLEKHGNDTNKGTVFSIIGEEAFKRLPATYKAISDIWEEPNKYGDIDTFMQWSTSFEAAINKKIEADILPVTWKQDEWAAHNIRFGMLLGYPGPAISSICWHEAERIKSGNDEEMRVVQMPYQGLYCGAHVTYEYESKLANEDTLSGHQKLWADVLNRVYKVFSEDVLLGMSNFKTEYQKFKLYDES